MEAMAIRLEAIALRLAPCWPHPFSAMRQPPSWVAKVSQLESEGNVILTMAQMDQDRWISKHQSIISFVEVICLLQSAAPAANIHVILWIRFFALSFTSIKFYLRS